MFLYRKMFATMLKIPLNDDSHLCDVLWPIVNQLSGILYIVRDYLVIHTLFYKLFQGSFDNMYLIEKMI